MGEEPRAGRGRGPGEGREGGHSVRDQGTRRLAHWTENATLQAWAPAGQLGILGGPAPGSLTAPSPPRALPSQEGCVRTWAFPLLQAKACPGLPPSSLVHLLIHSFTRSFIPALIYSSVHLFIHSLIYALIHSLTHSFTYSFLGTATHSSILAWRTPWTEEPAGLQFTGSQAVGHD